MLKEIKKARDEFIESENTAPRTIALSYLDGLDLLVEYSKTTGYFCEKEIDTILMKGDRAEITKKLNTMIIYGMKLTITDITI
jgi:hypothetical protein